MLRFQPIVHCRRSAFSRFFSALSLSFARPVVFPIVSAAIISLMLGPLASYAIARRIRAGLFAALLLFTIIGTLNISVIVLSAPIVE